jgi:hypothetical protein
VGVVKELLAVTTLPDREAHNSRLFVDLCENIHIHHREFRIVFSLDEYFEFIEILQRSTEDVRNFLAQNPDYREGEFPTTIMVAGGKLRQRQLLENSPGPNRSAYFPNHFAIELQDESVTDEIHIHWRDYRIVMPREHFRIVADQFTEARKQLDRFEKDHVYVRRPHHDRAIGSLQAERKRYRGWKTLLGGEADVAIYDITTRFKDFLAEFHPDPRAIQELQQHLVSGAKLFPILLSTERDGTHRVIDGHHRLYAAMKLGRSHINALTSSLTYQQSEDFRRAEGLLKKFDKDTGGQYAVSAFMKEYVAYKTSRFYADVFYRLTTRSPYWRSRRWVRKILGQARRRTKWFLRRVTYRSAGRA